MATDGHDGRERRDLLDPAVQDALLQACRAREGEIPGPLLSMISETPATLVLVDHQGRILTINNPQPDLPADEVIGRNIVHSMRPEDEDLIRGALAEAASSQESIVFQCFGVASGARYLVRATPDDDGNILIALIDLDEWAQVPAATRVAIDLRRSRRFGLGRRRREPEPHVEEFVAKLTPWQHEDADRRHVMNLGPWGVPLAVFALVALWLGIWLVAQSIDEALAESLGRFDGDDSAGGDPSRRAVLNCTGFILLVGLVASVIWAAVQQSVEPRLDKPPPPAVTHGPAAPQDLPSSSSNG